MFKVVVISFLVSGLVSVTFSFAVAPMGLSGTYLPFGQYAKAGKAGYGVSWSKNLDGELQLRRTLCHSITESLLYQYRYDNNTKVCYKIGEKGPCGENMIFYGYQTNAVYGECDCNYNDNGRALIYEEASGKCHFVFSRAYCKENEWLDFDSEWKPICETNKCIHHYDYINNGIVPTKFQKAVSIEYVPYKNSCALLGESCEERESQWNSLANLPHEVQFVKGKLHPRCAPTKYITWRFPTPKLQCVPGSLLAHKSSNSSSSSEQCHMMFEI